MPEAAAPNNLHEELDTHHYDEGGPVPFLLTSREILQVKPNADLWLNMTVVTLLLHACDRHPQRHADRCVSWRSDSRAPLRCTVVTSCKGSRCRTVSPSLNGCCSNARGCVGELWKCAPGGYW